MKNNNTNNWNSFSRGLFVALLILAIFCGICALGATFSNVPWLLLSGGICILLILGVIIWFLGYLSRSVKHISEDPGYDIDDIEIDEYEEEEPDEPSVQVFKKSNPPVKIVEDKPQEPEVAPQKPVAEAKTAAQSKNRAQQTAKRDISRFNMFPDEQAKK